MMCVCVRVSDQAFLKYISMIMPYLDDIFSYLLTLGTLFLLFFLFLTCSETIIKITNLTQNTHKMEERDCQWHLESDKRL